MEHIQEKKLVLPKEVVISVLILASIVGNVSGVRAKEDKSISGINKSKTGNVESLFENGKNLPEDVMDQIISHITEGRLKKQELSNGLTKFCNVSGVHSILAKGENVKIEKIQDSEDSNGFYDAWVWMYDDDLRKIHDLSGVAISEDWKGWKKKSVPSTMFPDSWDIKKIQQAIQQAYFNDGEGLMSKYDQNGNVHKIGFLENGSCLEFRIENTPNSVYPCLYVENLTDIK